MTNKTLPCPTLLRQLLSYEPETGMLFWKARPISMFNSMRACNAWNGKHLGKPAFISVHVQGYPQGQINRRTIKAHRVIWAMCLGAWPDTIDHIDGDVTNNRLSNLRNTTQAENNRNASIRSDNKSGQQGVHWNEQRQKWVAVVAGKYLGVFNTKSRAIDARKKSEKEYDFHQNHGR
jgi:hypothetical protein